MRRRLLRLLVVAIAVVAPLEATALTVSLAPGAGSSELRADVFRDIATPCCTFTQPLASLPASGQLAIPPVVPLIPPFEVTLDYALSNAALAFDYLTVREDAEDNLAGAEGTIFFSVDEAVGYALSGSYLMSDPAGHVALLSVVLEDLTSATTLYESAHHNSGTPDAAMVLGETTYETVNAGSLAGTLLPGHDYRFHFEAETTVFGGPPPDGTLGTGSGGVTLAFVPEARPAALLLAALSLLLPWGRTRTASPPGRSQRSTRAAG